MARVFTDAGGQALASASQRLADLDTFSVAFWLKRTSTPAAARGLIGLGTATGWNVGLTTGNLISADLIYSGATDKVRNSTTVPALNTWVHVVVTHNQTGLASTDFTFYFDGKSEAGANVSSGVTARINGAAPLTIGSGIGTLLAAPANIGPVAIWSRALSPAEALALAGGAHPLRFKEGLVEIFDMAAAHGEEGWLAKLYLVQGATNPTAADVSPPMEAAPTSVLETRQNVRPTVRSRARYNAATVTTPAPRAKIVTVQPRKRRARKLVAKLQRSPQQQSAAQARGPSKPITLVQPKKRKRRAGSGKILRPATTRSLRPPKAQTVVIAKKRRRRALDATLITGARRAPARPPKTLTQVVPRKRRKRVADTTMITGARRAAPTPAIRPARPLTQVTPKKRRRRLADVNVITGARRAQAAAPAVRPAKPIKIVAGKKRRQKPRPAQLLKPARGAAAVTAKRPTKTLTQVAPRKRRRRTGDATLLTGARRAAVVATPRKRSGLTVTTQKRRRKAPGRTALRSAPRSSIVTLQLAIATSDAAIDASTDASQPSVDQNIPQSQTLECT